MESNAKPKINYEEFSKIEITVGKILSAEKVPDTDKLLKLSVDFAEEAPRTIVSGIALYYPDPAILVGIQAAFVTNLEPRMIRDIESNGMILAASNVEGQFSLLQAPTVPFGTKVK